MKSKKSTLQQFEEDHPEEVKVAYEKHLAEENDYHIKRSRFIVDPPSGWKYGFPKELKPGVKYEDLLRSSGYPEKEIEFAIKYSRSWNE